MNLLIVFEERLNFGALSLSAALWWLLNETCFWLFLFLVNLLWSLSHSTLHESCWLGQKFSLVRWFSFFLVFQHVVVMVVWKSTLVFMVLIIMNLYFVVLKKNVWKSLSFNRFKGSLAWFRVGVKKEYHNYIFLCLMHSCMLYIL